MFVCFGVVHGYQFWYKFSKNQFIERTSPVKLKREQNISTNFHVLAS